MGGGDDPPHLMKAALRVGICGFGVAGGALAVLLARLGHDVMLMERAPQLGPVGAERRTHSHYLGRLSRMLSPFFQSENALLALGRDIALPLMCKLPWTRRQMELTVTGTKRGFSDQLGT